MEPSEQVCDRTSGGRPRSVDIGVVMIRNPRAPDGLEFKLTGEGKDIDNLEFHNRGHNGLLVNFHITDDAGTGYVFPDNRREAMWVKQIGNEDECPETPCYWEDFEAQAVTRNNQTLVVRNWNWRKERFAFALRFTRNPRGGPFVIFDPIGTNENGPRS